MTKDNIIEYVSRMPKDSSIEDVMYYINFMYREHIADQDIKEGRVYTTEEIREDLRRHRESYMEQLGKK